MRAILSIIAIVTFFLSSPALAHTLGVDKAELIETFDSTYHLISQVPNKLAHLITTPEIPERCRFNGSPGGKRGDYEVRFVFSCDSPLTADDEIVLPWKREGVLLTVTWKGSEPVTKLADREKSAIRIDLKV